MNIFPSLQTVIPYSTLVVFGLIATATPVQAVPIPGLYNTGVDAAGNVLPWHAIEPHYALERDFPTTPYVVRQEGTPGGLYYWADPPPGASWIGPNATDNLYHEDEVGAYSYRLTFSLVGLNYNAAQLAGYWGTDNSSQIRLNGVPTGYTVNDLGFVHFTPFLITSGFVPGINTLEFLVFNGGGPTGLLVGGLTGAVGEALSLPTVPYTTPGGPRGHRTPDGGTTLILLALGIAGLGVTRSLVQQRLRLSDCA